VSSIKHQSFEPWLPQLPNFCNLGIMLRLLLLVNVLCLAAALVKAGSIQQFPGHFLNISVVLQPALILSLPLLCGARQLLGELDRAKSLLVFIVIAAAIGAVSWYLMRLVVPPGTYLAFEHFTLLYVFVLVCVVVYFDLRSRALSPSVTEARLQALQSRIRPHFLFNSMNAALSLVRSEPRRAEQVLENLAELFRALMTDNRQLVRLDEEVNLCLNYLDIEQIRLGERLRVKWNIESMPSDALVPPLLLQPLVENAVYHGVEPLDGPGDITVEIKDLGKQIEIELTNPLAVNPATGSSSTHSGGNRMAIANIRERLQLHYDVEARLEADEKDGVYRVRMLLPKTRGSI
jgi:two-component system, LytTR family, sensor histidine kinase AlgZ